MKKLLQELGLEIKEIEIFLACFQQDQSTPTTISQKSGLKRSTVYFYLDRLEQKGLIYYEIRGKQRHIKTENAEACVERLVAMKECALNKAINNANVLHKELKQIEKKSANFSELTIFKGTSNTKNILKKILQTKEDIYWAGDLNVLLQVIPAEQFYKQFTLERMKQSTTTYAITDKRILKTPRFSEIIGNFREFRFLDQTIETPALLAMSGNFIFLFSREQEPMVVTIEDRNMKNIILLLFKSLWQRIPENTE